MATACLFIGWNRPVPGREREAFAFLMEEAIPVLDKFQAEGWCESYDVFGLTPHGGTVNSLVLLKGERAKLDELRRTDVFERFSMRLYRLLEGYAVVPGVTLDGIRKSHARTADLYS